MFFANERCEVVSLMLSCITDRHSVPWASDRGYGNSRRHESMSMSASGEDKQLVEEAAGGSFVFLIVFNCFCFTGFEKIF